MQLKVTTQAGGQPFESNVAVPVKEGVVLTPGMIAGPVLHTVSAALNNLDPSGLVLEKLTVEVLA